MIYTSYFAQMKKLCNEFAKDSFVSIARYSPFWYHGLALEALMPSKELLAGYRAGKITVEEYTKQFNAQLANLNVHDYGEALQGHVLICFERSEEFCHRHLVTKWLNDNGYECEEWK